MDTSAPQPDLAALLDHSEWLHALARRLVRDDALAEDLVQETWMAALRHPPDASRPARPWLAGVLRNLVLLTRRSEGRRGERQREAAQEDRLPSAGELAASVDTGRRLAGLVLELGEPYRTTVLLRYWHDLSSAEIARRQGVPEGTVRWRLKHGMDSLRGRLDANYGERRQWHTAFLGMLHVRELGRGTGAASLASTGWIAGLLAVLVLGLASRALWRRSPEHHEALRPEQPSLAAGALERRAEPSAATTSERASLVAAPSEPASMARRVRVLDELEHPVPEAIVILDDGSAGGQEAACDEAGWASFPEGARAHTAYVRAPGRFIEGAGLSAEQPAHILRLRSDERLSGRLLVDGIAPRERIRLVLTMDYPRFPDGVPAPLEARYGSARRAVTYTDEDGSFTFTGLDPSWSGTLEIPKPWCLPGEGTRRGSGPRIHYDGPERGLLIDLADRPYLLGRVQVPEGTLDFEGVRVTLTLRYLDGSERISRSALDDDCGYILVLGEGDLELDALASAELEVVSRDGSQAATRVLALEELRTGSRLPDLALAALDSNDPAAPRRIEVHTQGNRPPLGLLVELELASGTILSARTGADETGEHGLALFSGSALEQAIALRLVDALGRPVHSLAAAELSDRSGTIVIPLEQAFASLEFIAQDSEGRRLVETEIQIECPTGPKTVGRTDAAGYGRLGPLQSGSFDALFRRKGFAWRLEHVTLPPEGQKLLIVLEPELTFRLVLQDEQGQPLPGAEIRAHAQHPLLAWPIVSQGDGSYLIEGLGRDPLELDIRTAAGSESLTIHPLLGELRHAFQPRPTSKER